ncbi:MAG: DivIVA domain-containing protein [Corynebacteriales bacterium]|nr:DivIVA domain-containing protein [Mycobacteriales bacterium]
MPLTPADVHNVIFKKPPIGKRGYDEDDVDAFLDEVERELARLIEENNELKSQAGRGGAAAGAPSSDGELRRVAAENNELKQQIERLRQEKQAAPAAAAKPMGSGLSDTTGEQQALRVLMLAQRTAEEHVTDARLEADKLLSEARTKAEELTRDARAKSEALERDARQRHQEAMGGLDAKRNALQKHIEGLKAFEREYRTRLKAFLETQLHDLDGRSQEMEAEASTRSGANGSLTPSGSFGQSFGLSESSESRR